MLTTWANQISRVPLNSPVNGERGSKGEVEAPILMCMGLEDASLAAASGPHRAEGRMEEWMERVGFMQAILGGSLGGLFEAEFVAPVHHGKRERESDNITTPSFPTVR